MRISQRAPVPMMPRWMAGGGRGMRLEAGREAAAEAEGLRVAEAEGVGAREGLELAEAEARGGEARAEVGEARGRRAERLGVRRRELARLRERLEARGERQGGAGGGGSRGLKPPPVRSVRRPQAVSPGRDGVTASLPRLAALGTPPRRGGGAGSGRLGGEDEAGRGPMEKGLRVGEARGKAGSLVEASGVAGREGLGVRLEAERRRAGRRRAEFDVEGDLRLELGR